jgi:cellobiose epimerase
MGAWSFVSTRYGRRTAVATVIAVSGTLGVVGGEPDAVQQRASSVAEIGRHVDRQWFLDNLIRDNLNHWRDAGATPSGFFQINLDREWREPAGEPREATAVSQGRQIYNMAVGYEFSRDQRFLTALDRGIEFLTSRMHDDKHGGYFARVSPDGTVLDDSKQSYGLSFIVFGLAHAARVTKNAAYADAAMRALAEMKPMQRDGLFYVGSMNREFTTVAARGGGRAAGAPSAGAAAAGTGAAAPAEPARGHGFNQHLFEALLALYDATGSRAVFNQMVATLEEMASHFDHEYGYLPESFDANWKKTAGDRLNVGHLYEWAWLFSRAVEEGAPNGSKYIAMGNRMIDLGNKVGYNRPAGGIWSGADVNGNVPNKQMVWWCQAELLRATAHYAIRHGRSDLWPSFDQSLAFLRANFLDAEYGGWYYAWIPDLPRDQMPLAFRKGKVDGASAATGKTSYHDIAMYHDILRITDRR